MNIYIVGVPGMDYDFIGRPVFEPDFYIIAAKNRGRAKSIVFSLTNTDYTDLMCWSRGRSVDYKEGDISNKKDHYYWHWSKRLDQLINQWRKRLS